MSVDSAVLTYPYAFMHKIFLDHVSSASFLSIHIVHRWI